MHKLTPNVSSYILLALSVLQSHFRSQCSGYFFPFPYSFPATMPAPIGSSHAPITTTSSMSYGGPLFNMAPYQDKTEVIVVGGGKQDQHHHHHHHHHHKHGHHHSHGHEHAHDHNHNHGHSHIHEHKHDHGHSHNHDHDHKHGHQHGHNHHHEHKHDHDNIHNHNHGHHHHHSHGHLHGHGHLHDQNHKHGHAHQHGHKDYHGHNHDHKHDQIHGIHNEGHDRLKQHISFHHQNNLAKFARHNTDNDDQIFPNDHSEQQNKGMFDDQEGEIKYVPNQDELRSNNDNSFNGHGFNQNYQQLEQIYNSGERNDNSPPHHEQQNEQHNFLEEPDNADPGPELVPVRQKNFILLAKDVKSHKLGEDGQVQSYGVHLGQTEFVQDSGTVQDKQESMSILNILRQNGRIVTLRAGDPLVSIEKPLRMKQDYIDITLGSDGLKSRFSTGFELTPDEDYDTSIGKFDAIYNVQEYD